MSRLVSATPPRAALWLLNHLCPATEREPFIGDALAMAQAAHNCGGIVIAQVERIRTDKNPSRAVRVPGILVDAIVVDPDQPQTYAVKYNPGYSGELKVPVPKPAPAGRDTTRARAAPPPPRPP